MSAVHLALDVYYAPTWARGACVGFARPEDALPAFVHVEQFEGAPGDYEPGDFKKRELPYLEDLVDAARARAESIASIVIDGYVWLDDNRPGLGAHLFDALAYRVPIIGVAKTRYRGAPAIEILRGESKSPLFVTTAGLEPAAAARFIESMHGEHRIPTMLRLADRASRD